jgi:hypothetical protein
VVKKRRHLSRLISHSDGIAGIVDEKFSVGAKVIAEIAR